MNKNLLKITFLSIFICQFFNLECIFKLYQDVFFLSLFYRFLGGKVACPNAIAAQPQQKMRKEFHSDIIEDFNSQKN